MKPTILIIDDFASVRLYHMTFLERHGYRCLEASNGEEALARLGEEPVDLVVLDLLMPEMDGATFLTKMRAQPQSADLPVLVITSEHSVAKERGLIADALVAVLNKPVMPAVLLNNVRRLLPQAPTPAIS